MSVNLCFLLLDVIVASAFLVAFATSIYFAVVVGREIQSMQ